MSPSRNAPCPCGSGRKYKHCHGATDAERAPAEAAAPPAASLRATLARAQDLQARGYLPEAEILYREVLQRSPRHADAMSGLGILFAQRGESASALEWLDKAIDADPGNAAYRFNRGKALLQFGRPAEACAALELAGSLDPRSAAACHELGRARAQTGNASDAEAAFRTALSLDPSSWEAHNDLGLLLHGLGRSEEACSSLRSAVDLQPGSVAALRNLGMVLRSRKRAEEAVEAYRAALALQPRDPVTLSNLGNALLDLSRRDEALACFREALAMAPGYADAYHNWGLLHLRSGEFRAAAERFRAALAINPDLAEAEKALASVLHDLGDVEEAVRAGRRSLRLRPDDRETHSQLLFSLLHSAEIAPQQVFEEHRDWARKHASGLVSASPHRNSPDAERRLRIGYVSGDFRHHPVAQFFEPVLARHDRAVFEVFCYHNLRQADETTDQLRRSADCWREIASLDDVEAADTVRADGIDILVDLSGHTRLNRLLVFARKPAPVQATWLGYPGTTGLDAIDYRITDARASPEGFDALHSERLVRLPDSQWCYQPPRDCPAVADPPAGRTGSVTLGAFSSLAKIGPRMIALWSKLLHRLGDAKLMVVGLGLESMLEEYGARFAAEGVAPERIVLHGFQSFRDYLELHGAVDLMLDTAPYTGGTTTCHALWMGVPVVSLAGRATASRGGASLLGAVGLRELVAESPEQYLDKALSLAESPDTLASLRAGMRARMSDSPLMDVAGFTHNLEQTYRSMWRHWCSASAGADG